MNGVSEFCRRRALELYPQLARAVPPKPLGHIRENPLRVGDAPYAVVNYWWRDHMREHCLRTTNDPSRVIGPIKGKGSCLHPLREDGDEMFFDPTIPAQPGDIVLFQSDFEAGMNSDLRFMAKMLVEFAEEYWLAFNEGMFPLRDIKILGVEVRNPFVVSISSRLDLDECRAVAP